MPVARSGLSWCHHAPGTPPAVPRTTAGRLACYASPGPYEVVAGRGSRGVNNGLTRWSLTGREACHSEHCVMIVNEGHNKDDQGHHDVGEGRPQPPRTLSHPVVPQDACPEPLSLPTTTHHDGAAATNGQQQQQQQQQEDEGEALKSCLGSQQAAISGSGPQPHLCPTSAAAVVTEANGDQYDKADVPPLPAEAQGGPEEDSEVIETLDEDAEASGDEEATEEDIDDDTVLRGKFCNLLGFKERVRRLSEGEASDGLPPPPTTVIYFHDDEGEDRDEGVEDEEEHLLEKEEQQQKSVIEQAAQALEEAVTIPELTSQLSELTVEHVGVQVDPAEAEGECDGEGEVEGSSDENTRSSSEETEHERIDDYKMRVKRSSSLKCDKTPPGTPGRKKIVRFADVLGLDLAAVRTFLGGGVPRVPRSAFWDLQPEKRANATATSTDAAAAALEERRLGVPRRVLTPLFQQPGLNGNFLERVRTQRVVVQSVDVGDDMSVRGVVRVLNLDFHKTVVVRYTFDHWRNYHEATASYIEGSYDGLTDQFSFLLWGSFLQDNGALAFCVKYHTLGQEFWDNNFGRNYILQCYSITPAPQGEGSSSSSSRRGPSLPHRPQNSSMVQQQFDSHHHHGGSSHASHRPYHAFHGSSDGSPTSHHDPWVTSFF